MKPPPRGSRCCGGNRKQRNPNRPPVIPRNLWRSFMKHDDARKILRSRGGLKITIDDTADRERFVIETSGGQKFLLQNGPGQIEVSDGNGSTARFDAGGITVNAAAKVTINASEVEINSGTITLNSGMSK